MNKDLRILCLKGQDILPFIPELARLRIEIFKSYPYLYDGDLDYEYNYLNTYVQCNESIIVLALDHGKVVGVSSAIPLEFETIEFQKPFLSMVLILKMYFILENRYCKLNTVDVVFIDISLRSVKQQLKNMVLN